MKLTRIITPGLFAFATAALLVPHSARAQSISYSAGDLVLGFEDYSSSSVTGTADYLVDLGPASYFTGLSGGTVVNLTTSDPAHDGQSQVGLGNLATDLATAFNTSNGAPWYTDGTLGNNVQWGIIGATPKTTGEFGLSKATIFLTTPEETPGQGAETIPTTGSVSQQQSWDGNVLNLTAPGNGFGNVPSTSNNAYGAFESNSLTDSWSSEIVNNSDFGTGFNIEQPLDGSNFGPTNSQLDLYELVPNASSATELGTLTLDSSGDLVYTAAVPEPSTYATVALGAAFLVMFRRRLGSRIVA